MMKRRITSILCRLSKGIVKSAVFGTGSTDRVKTCRDRFLESPLIADVEYIQSYRDAHEDHSRRYFSTYELRAECHSSAMELMTPVIRDGELIVGSKSRFVRGAQIYCNCASEFVLRELDNILSDSEAIDQDDEDFENVYEVGSVSASSDLLSDSETDSYVKFGGKFLLPQNDVSTLSEIATYFNDKCMQSVGDSMWREHYDEAEFVENGWKSVLFTAAHDPAPDGRMILDYRTGLAKGLRQIITEIEERIRNRVNEGVLASDEKISYWRACIRVLEGSIQFARNYSQLAAEMASLETDKMRRAELMEICRICAKVPEHPPESFREAMQAFWFLYLCGHIESSYLGYSVGRFDQYMFPYFEIDGRENVAETMELIELLRIKMQELEYLASFSWEGLGSGNLFQNLILGGENEHGEGADNELSELILQSSINCKTSEPSLSIWYTDGLSNQFLMKATEVIKTGVGFPAFFNKKVYLQHELEKSKLPLDIIREYAAIGGCTEPTLEGMAYGIVQPGFINHLKVLEIALFGGSDPVTGYTFDSTLAKPSTYEEVEENYLKMLQKSIAIWQEYWNIVMVSHKQVMNNIYASTLTRDCLDRGLSLDDGGAVLNCSPTTLSTGLVNVVNSLAGIKCVLSDDDAYDMDTLREALLSNFDADVEMFSRIHRVCRDAPKWGNDDDFVDSIYVKLFNEYCSFVEQGTNYLGEPYDPSMLAISTHIPFGKACLASPDGRFKGDPLADGVTSPMRNTDKNGVFAVLRSSQKIDHRKIRGGLLNIKFHPVSLRGVEGSKKLLQLVDSYFSSNNAFQIQFNCVDSNVLRDAQTNPENYRDLVVRVAGFSANFVELSEGIQNEIIERTEHFFDGGERFDFVESTDSIIDQDTMIDSQASATVFDVQDFSVGDGNDLRMTVFLKGCPLDCLWCQNPEGISQNPQYMFRTEVCKNCENVDAICIEKLGRGEIVGDIVELPNNHLVQENDPSPQDLCKNNGVEVVGKTYTVTELFDEEVKNKLRFLSSRGGITFSGGEPMLNQWFLSNFIDLLSPYNLSCGIETSGQFLWEEGITEDLLKKLDFIYFDIKAISKELHESITGFDNVKILENLEKIIDSVGAKKVVISFPVVPHLNGTLNEFSKVLGTMKELGLESLRVLPVHNMADGKYLGLGKTDRSFSWQRYSNSEFQRLFQSFKDEAKRSKIDLTFE